MGTFSVAQIQFCAVIQETDRAKQLEEGSTPELEELMDQVEIKYSVHVDAIGIGNDPIYVLTMSNEGASASTDDRCIDTVDVHRIESLSKKDMTETLRAAAKELGLTIDDAEWHITAYLDKCR
jgi:hypothetical protein